MIRTLIYISIGGLLGATLTTWLGPKLIGWWFKPPVTVPIDCTSAIQWSMNRLVLSQIGGIVGGFLLGLIFALVFGKKSV